MLELIEKVKSSEEFKNKKAYLCSVFIMNDQVQFSFYDKETKLVTSFRVENNKVSIIGKDEKIFQKESKDLEELKLNEIKIDLNKAKEIANNLVKEKYHNETINKEIIILQVINKKIIWNITKISATFNIINIRLNAISGEIIEDKMESALNFRSRPQ